MNPEEVIALNGELAKFAHSLHELGGKLILAGVVLHILGAFKHHIIDKDGTLKRMFGSEV